jgi:hypothetical protein
MQYAPTDGTSYGIARCAIDMTRPLGVGSSLAFRGPKGPIFITVGHRPTVESSSPTSAWKAGQRDNVLPSRQRLYTHFYRRSMTNGYETKFGHSQNQALWAIAMRRGDARPCVSTSTLYGIAPCAVRHNMLVEPPDHPSASVPSGTEPDGAMGRCRDTQGVHIPRATPWVTLPGYHRPRYRGIAPSYKSIQSNKSQFRQERKAEPCPLSDVGWSLRRAEERLQRSRLRVCRALPLFSTKSPLFPPISPPKKKFPQIFFQQHPLSKPSLNPFLPFLKKKF